MGMTDVHAALVARIAMGDHDALALLAADYHPRLWRYLARQLGADIELVEDVLQEVYLAIWQGAGSYRGDARVSTWIFQIAHYRALDVHRARARRQRRLIAESGADDCACHDRWDDELSETDTPNTTNTAVAGAVPSHEDALVERVILTDALRALSPKQREAIDLVCCYGFTVDETASILGVPSGTVKSRLSYGRRALAALLRKGSSS